MTAQTAERRPAPTEPVEPPQAERPAVRPAPRRGPVPAIALAAAGLLAIGVAQWGPTRLGMEDDLTGRSRQALQQAGVQGVRVGFTGRDGVLQGTAGSQAIADRAVAVVEAQQGVRTARSDLTVALPQPPAPLADADIKLTINGRRVLLHGRVPDQASHDKLLQSVRGVFGTADVQDLLTVDGTAGTAGLDGLDGVLQALGPDVQRATIALTRGRLTLAGYVAGPAVRTAVEQAAVTAVGSPAAVVDRLEIGPPPAQ